LTAHEDTVIIERYDPVLDKSVTDLEPIPSKRSGIGATNVDRSIYVSGVERRRGTFDNNERYNPITNTWTIEASMPTARHGLGVASIDGKICLIGGGAKSRINRVMEE